MFKTDGNTDYGKINKWPVGFQGAKRMAILRIHKSFTDNIILQIKQTIYQLKTEIGNGKGISVWIEESNRQAASPLLTDSAGFSGKNVGCLVLDWIAWLR
jgi:hypothetical protein